MEGRIKLCNFQKMYDEKNSIDNLKMPCYPRYVLDKSDEKESTFAADSQRNSHKLRGDDLK